MQNDEKLTDPKSFVFTNRVTQPKRQLIPILLLKNHGVSAVYYKYE